MLIGKVKMAALTHAEMDAKFRGRFGGFSGILAKNLGWGRLLAPLPSLRPKYAIFSALLRDQTHQEVS